MAEPNVLVVCVFAFTAVFVLLALLAGVMRVLMAVFPERTAESEETALMAAVAAAAALAFPGTAITKVEEIR